MVQRILRLPEVEELTGKSRSSIYADTTFPKPVKIGKRSSGWVESEIVAWQSAKIAQRDGAPAGGVAHG